MSRGIHINQWCYSTVLPMCSVFFSTFHSVSHLLLATTPVLKEVNLPGITQRSTEREPGLPCCVCAINYTTILEHQSRGSASERYSRRYAEVLRHWATYLRSKDIQDNSAINEKNDLLIPATTWMNLKIVVRSERSQTKENSYSIVSLIKPLENEVTSRSMIA